MENKKFERKVSSSFKKVKKDIFHLEKQILQLSRQQERILDTLNKVYDIESELTSEAEHVEKGVKKKKKSTKFIASKNGKAYHSKSCPMVKNIKETSKLEFNSKQAASMKGYKAHNCVK